MATAAVLVDSSFYIGLARNGQDPLQALAYAAVDRDLAVCGVVRCEVGRGIRQRKITQAIPVVLGRNAQCPHRQSIVVAG